MNLRNLLRSSYIALLSVRTGKNLLVDMARGKLPKKLVKTTSVWKPFHVMPLKEQPYLSKWYVLEGGNRKAASGGVQGILPRAML
jgi:hypothetical protein